MKILDNFLKQNKLNPKPQNNSDENLGVAKDSIFKLHPEILEEAILAWEEPEFLKKEKSKKWYLVAGSVMLSLILIMLAMKNITGAFVLVILSFVGYVFSLKNPNVYQFAVHQKGIAVGKKIYPFEKLRSFWIFERNGNDNELLIKGDGAFAFGAKIPVSTLNAGELREILLKFLAEEEEEESLIDLASKIIGF